MTREDKIRKLHQTFPLELLFTLYFEHVFTAVELKSSQ